MNITKKRALGGGVIAISALALAACGAAPEETTSTSTDAPAETAAATDFLPCIVSDYGGFDDRSFNQLGYEGIQAAGEQIGVEPVAVESANSSEYQPNVDGLLAEGCNLIVTVGFDLATTTGLAAEANPEVEFVSIDDPVDADFDGATDFPNVKALLYDTSQAAFLAGYAAAAVSETGKVGTFGGMEFPTVTIFMEGYEQGVEYWNEQNDGSVEVIGMDSFTGGFSADPSAVATAQSVIDQDVDVIFPVGGPVYQSAASVIRDSGRDIALIGADADIYVSDPSVGDLLLTSVLKGMDISVEETVLAAANGEFDGAPYIGTLENGGVGLAPFHDWESKVPEGLQAELDELAAGIIDGSVPVESYLAE